MLLSKITLLTRLKHFTDTTREIKDLIMILVPLIAHFYIHNIL